MTDKTRRQGAILRLVREREISTQSRLVDALRAAGHGRADDGLPGRPRARLA